MCIADSALVDAQNLEHANLVQFSSVVHAQYPHMQIVLVAAAATKLAAWMQRKLELKTGIRLQLLFSLLPLLSYCLLLSMLLLPNSFPNEHSIASNRREPLELRRRCSTAAW